MHEFLKNIYRAILKRLPTKLVLSIENIRGYKRRFKKNRTEYFGEKIQWMKLYGNLERYQDLVDKYAVRKHIENTIGKEYLIEMLGVYDTPEEIDFDTLPNAFVLKLNTGSGYNIICSDKTKLDKKKTIRQLKKWLKEDYSKIKKEPQYKHIQKKIICEKYMADENGTLLDYKLYCIGGKVECIEVDFDRFDNHAMNFYDTEWNLLDLRKGKYPTYTGTVEKPKKLEEMIQLAETLSKDLPLARMDFYYVEDKIYFGEITLTPAGGVTAFKPLEKDKELANKINLDGYKQIKVLSILRTSRKNNILDGVTVKSRVLENYIKNIPEIQNVTVDVDDWKKRSISIVWQIFRYYKKVDKIIVCTSSNGAYLFFKLLHILRYKKDIFYFVAGGMLHDIIQRKQYDLTIYQNMKEIYVESDEMLQKMQALGLQNVKKICNFREVKEFQNAYVQDNVCKFVFYGRIAKEKGIEEAIKVINRLHEQQYPVRLDIYGQTPNKEYLEKLKQLANPTCITFKGAITPNNQTEYEILSQYDVFVLPTEHIGEGLPGALIDAYIAGLAVVVSDWKYAREYVQDEKNGLIFKYKDYEDFYDKMKSIIENGNISEYKQVSNQMAKQYLVEHVLTDFKQRVLEKDGVNL